VPDSSAFSKRRRSLLRAAGALALAPAWALAGRNPLGKPRVLLGPMVGEVQRDSARLWLRMSGDYFDSVVEYTTEPWTRRWRETEPFRARLEDELVARPVLDGVEPGSEVFYRLRVHGNEDRYLRHLPPFRLRLAPTGPTRFRVAFGSCARVQDDPRQPIWHGVAKWQPDLFFWLGDNIYGDSLNPEVLAAEYRRQRFVPSFQPIGRSTPQLATWDDHDYGLDNYDRTNPIKKQAQRLFEQYWANPPSGSDAGEGVYFAWSYGGVDFVFLDCRYWRSENTDPDGPDKTMLGETQLAWLKRTLAHSRAPFKVLVSGSNWALGERPGSDTWAGFTHERNALFEFIRENDIGGVVLLAGNTHFPYASCAPWSELGGYDFYDLTSSALAQTVTDEIPLPTDPTAPIAPDRFIRPPLLNVNNAGILEFDMNAEDPELRFNVMDTRGRTMWPWLSLRASELVNGVSSWRDKRIGS
jgi:alkaline phosphatase D